MGEIVKKLNQITDRTNATTNNIKYKSELAVAVYFEKEHVFYDDYIAQ